MTEDALHKQIVHYLRHALPASAIIHHSPNENAHGVQWRMKNKALGTHAGWPDLEIVWRDQLTFIELKTKRGKVSPAQAATHRALAMQGYPVLVWRSLEDAEDWVRTYGQDEKPEASESA